MKEVFNIPFNSQSDAVDMLRYIAEHIGNDIYPLYLKGVIHVEYSTKFDSNGKKVDSSIFSLLDRD